MPANKQFQTMLQLRIELQHSNPLIWRTILIPKGITLIKLHRAIQHAMGWWDGHLHEFDINGIRYGMVDPEWDQDPELEDEKRKRLSRVLAGRKRFDYLYDFGDHWLHKIKVEKAYSVIELPSQIFCVAGENSCPPEDVGGLPGYSELLEIIADPNNEEREDMLNWLGSEDFDPSYFDQNEADARLREIKL
tara:strand:+ start:264 stop:836 length:573 start_codon:yes stop_codon:yes gene_type:complete